MSVCAHEDAKPYCSGAAYPTVPSNAVSRPEWFRLHLAAFMSMSLTTPSGEIMILDGLISRWIIGGWALWSSRSIEHSCRIIFSTCSSFKTFCSSRICCSVVPLIYSSNTMSWLESSITSYMRGVFLIGLSFKYLKTSTLYIFNIFFT